jgi:TfoX/Sxy family transcriptional regulator of competence genes
MAYNEDLAERVREELADEPGLTERKMFGGLAFMLDGNMCCGVSGDELMIRIPPEETDDALGEPGVRPMDMTGRPMKGWLVVGGEAIAAEAGLAQWVDRSRRFAHSLPPKRAR